QPEAAPAVAPAALSAEAVAKHEKAEKIIADILKLMELPARMEVKDGADGSVSVALFFEAEVPAAPNGRRSHLVDSLQFLVNKVINRPNSERRWINIGVGAHPEPRSSRPERPAQKAQPQPHPPRANGAPPAAAAQGQQRPSA